MRIYGPKPSVVIRQPMELTAVLEVDEDVLAAVHVGKLDLYLESARHINTPQGKRLWVRWRSK